MGNWNRHFVRVDSLGNIGIFDTAGNFMGDWNFSNSTVTYNARQFNANNNYQMFGNNVSLKGQYIQGPTFDAGGSLSSTGVENNYVVAALAGFPVIAGTPDLRTGITAADASPITIFSSTTDGFRYEVKARILATSGVSATYTISWTEGGAARTVALTVTAAGTEYHDNFVIAPDSGTNITAQITSLTSSTVNVDAIVSVLG